MLPSLYAIIDRASLDARGVGVGAFAEALRDAGVRLLQYRDKTNGPQEILRAAREVADIFSGLDATLILNDRADLAALLGWGVHVGQGDLPVEAARRVVGKAVVGISTHNEAQLLQADSTSANYIAVGPVFATTTKLDAESVVGVAGVRLARQSTAKPLVAIGGITTENVSQVWSAGADSVAVISGLLSPERKIAESVQRFCRRG